MMIGALSVAAGTRAAQGWQPGYTVLSWLPIYNLAMGAWTVLVPTVLIWIRSRYAVPASLGTLGVHVSVLLLLASGVVGTPARESMLAMAFRVATWLVIVALLVLERRRGFSRRASGERRGV
ncbi:MAG: hypothetical protein Q8M79_00880 [Dehalococcoidia bacterium]|nr:hypothetical protein [Dehalococcoidia bacterium]